MDLERSAGVLLHLTSLPGPGGIGDLGSPAHAMLAWLDRAGCRLWQFLPLTPIGRGWSPYQSRSSFAGSPLLISLERLVEDGWLDRKDLTSMPESTRVDFERVDASKRVALAQAVERWRSRGRPGYDDIERWCEANRRWLEDYALYAALRGAHDGKAWTEWEPGLARRDPAALADVRRKLSQEIEYHRLVQFWFYQQWDSLRREAEARRIRLIGDLPIYPDHDSADVWARPDLFKLNPLGEPEFLAGVPPDYYSKTGQLWEAPVYRWERHHEEGYQWWIERVGHAAASFDSVRLDHFRGLEAYWEVPAPAETAEGGVWARGPGADLLDALRADLGTIPIIAEDLGFITPEVVALRDAFELPGMRVLQLELVDTSSDSEARIPHLPRSVAYTGTHDNDTSRGWFETADEAVRTSTLDFLGGDGSDIVERMIRWVWSSAAGWAVAPIQDFLSLGSEARMNYPGRREGNWGWRLTRGQLSDRLANDVLKLNRETDR
jgi:4-alpha-glucanotransferase